jgi:integration host factor subunit beta
MTRNLNRSIERFLNMVKSELIENLAQRADITLAKAEEIVDLFFDAMSDALCKGGRVEIRGFGAFTVREYKSYTGRNPKTGEKIEVPIKRLPFWKTGQELKQRVDSAFDGQDSKRA